MEEMPRHCKRMQLGMTIINKRHCGLEPQSQPYEWKATFIHMV
jgi:hypothetical protein